MNTRRSLPAGERLSEKQLDFIRELLEASIAQGAEAMGQMLRIRVDGELLGFGDGRFEPIHDLDLLGQFRAHVVKVALKGEINGAFYFIINAHEVELINSVSMPAEIAPTTNSESRQMKHGFMSEIENMIAAGCIAQISEFLGVELLGAVPEIQIMEGETINEYLKDEIDANESTFYVKSLLSGVAVNISPYFIWMLDDNFRDILKLNIVS